VIESSRQQQRSEVRAAAPQRLGRVAGVEGNERLTATAGALLVLLLAAEGVTILSIRPLLSAHVFIGMLLIPPVALKLGSTGWRFVHYYCGDQEYRAQGPPLLPLRMLAPLVVASTLAVLTTGVALLVAGPGGGVLLGLHKASFVIWLGVTAIHVLAHLRRLPGLVAADWGGGEATAPAGSFTRRALIAGALVAGAVLATVTVRYAQPWVHWAALFRGGDG
jgi:hypothetical protein